MENGNQTETERKRNKRVAKPVDGRQKFGALLKWHLARGTRAGGDPATHGIPWNRKRFGDAIRPAGSNSTRNDSIDRTVRNWCNGSNLPNDLRTIESVLFGPEQVNRHDDSFFYFRQDFREAFHAALQGTASLSLPATKDRVEEFVPIPLPGRCFGRDPEKIRGLAVLCRQRGGSLLITGNAGHGKTMLTQVLATHSDVVQKFGGRRIFVELERAESAELAVRELAGSLGMELASTFSAILLRLEKFSEPVLLVLDNLETPLQAPGQRQSTERILARLAGVPGLSLIASLRSHETVGAVDWSEIIFLENLRPGSAQAMFLAIARLIREADPDLTFFTGENGVLGGIPLAIRLAAHRVFAQKTLQTLKRDWERHGALLASLPAPDNLRSDSLLTCIEFSLRSSRLQKQGLLLFSLLGQLPAGLDQEDCVTLLGEAAANAIAQLRSVGLLRDSDGDRIGLLPPVRDIARRRHPPESALEERWIVHFLDLVRLEGVKAGGEDGQSAMQRIIPEMPNITAAFSSALSNMKQMEAARNALQGFERAIRFTGYRADATLEQLEAAYHKNNDTIALARCLYTRGNAARMRSENASARPPLEEAVMLLSGCAEHALAGRCLFALGELARMEDRHDDARTYYADGQLQFQLAGNSAGEGDCIFGIAEILRMREEHGAAREAYLKAADFYQRAGSLAGEADCLVGVAEMARRRDESVSAKENFTAALGLFKQAGWRAGEADSLWGIACVAMMHADYTAARQYFEMALELHDNDGTLLGCANCNWGLAEVERQQMHAAAAATLYEKAIELFRAAAWPGGVALGEAGLAKVMPKERAVQLFESALQAFSHAGMLLDEAGCMLGLAALREDLEARRLCEAAKQLYKRAESPNGIRNCDILLEEMSNKQEPIVKHVASK